MKKIKYSQHDNYYTFMHKNIPSCYFRSESIEWIKMSKSNRNFNTKEVIMLENINIKERKQNEHKI